MRIHKTISIVSTLMLLTVVAQADWDRGDPHKMHYPQLPDPNGWDVTFMPEEAGVPRMTLADDFKCRESGEITEVHFWVSWMNDQVEWASIENIHLSLHSDMPEGPFGWSQPDKLLWEWNSRAGDFQWKERFYEFGDQGWYDPLTGQWQQGNHQETWQINITDIREPFYQEEGTIYWLDIRIDQTFGSFPIGWKTSQDHFNDDAVWRLDSGEGFIPGGENWTELRDPLTGESLDMAFVIVPEPNAIAMIVITGAGFIFVRRRFLI